MRLINISDLTNLTYWLDLKTINDKDFIGKYFPKEQIHNIISHSLSLRIMLDNIANRIVARCLIVGNRLMTGKDENYERILAFLALQWQKCGFMVPKHPDYYRKRDKLVNEVLAGNKELSSKIADLKYIKKEILDNLTSRK